MHFKQQTVLVKLGTNRPSHQSHTLSVRHLKVDVEKYVGVLVQWGITKFKRRQVILKNHNCNNCVLNHLQTLFQIFLLFHLDLECQIFYVIAFKKHETQS